MYSRTSGRNRPVFISLVIAAIIIITLYYRGTGEGLIGNSQRYLLVVVAPLQKGVNVLISPIRRLGQYTLVVRQANGRNLRLKNQNQELRREIDGLKRYKNENKRLKRLAGFRETTELKTVAARVISRSPTSWQSLVTIDVGKNDGIAEGMPVATEKGLVGKTVRVSGSASLVQLLDDRRSGVAVELQRTGETAVAEGSMGDVLSLRFLEEDADVKVGDKLVVSGVGGVFPRGLVVGYVSKSSPNIYSIEKDISVRPAVNYARLSEVLVILNTPKLEKTK